MPKPKRQKPELKLLLPSPWLQKTVQDIPYLVHIPSRRSGIHIRGLARLCGVSDGVIRNAIKNAQKAESEVRYIRTTEINNILKNRIIFLEDVRYLGFNSLQKVGPVKVICADVCADLIHYYAEKGHEAALKSAMAFMRLGIEQYIFTQVGFIPRPESIVINDIDYLIAKETIQVTKSRLEEVRFFTNPITGECGIDLPSLGYLCGGVATRHIEKFVTEHNEPFLLPQEPEQIVKAPVCADTLHYFGEVHTPRKTVAKYWSKALDPIVPTLHQKTHYQSPPNTDREAQLAMRLQEQDLEIKRLRQLAKEDKDLNGRVKWHRIMARLLQKSIPNNTFEVRAEAETSQVAQLLDILILKRPRNKLAANCLLPDGLNFAPEINLLSYKSHQESLTSWAIQELVSHYVGYRKMLATQNENNNLPDAVRFQLYAVTTMFPQALSHQMGENWQTTEQTGVYQLFVAGLMIIVIVTNQIPAAPHNSPWNLLSHDPALVRYALDQSPLPADLQQYFESISKG